MAKKKKRKSFLSVSVIIYKAILVCIGVVTYVLRSREILVSIDIVWETYKTVGIKGFVDVDNTFMDKNR